MAATSSFALFLRQAPLLRPVFCIFRKRLFVFGLFIFCIGIYSKPFKRPFNYSKRKPFDEIELFTIRKPKTTKHSIDKRINCWEHLPGRRPLHFQGREQLLGGLGGDRLAAEIGLLQRLPDWEAGSIIGPWDPPRTEAFVME